MTLDQMALTASREAYLQAVKLGQGPSEVVLAVVAAYVVSAQFVPSPVSRPSAISPMSRALSQMAVGDVTVFPNTVNASNLCRYFVTARRLLGAPDARWSARTLPDMSVQVTRNPDGVSTRDPRRNAMAVVLADIQVGSSRLIKDKRVMGRGGSWANIKLQARRIVGNNSADWSRRSVSNGVRVTRIFGPASQYNGRPKTLMGTLTSSVAQKHSLKLDDLIGPSRDRPISNARQEAMWLLYEQKTLGGAHLLSTPAIGIFLGGRDHTTVLHGIRRHEERIAEAKAKMDADGDHGR